MRNSLSQTWYEQFFHMVKSHMGVVVNEQDWIHLKADIQNHVRNASVNDPEQYLILLRNDGPDAQDEWRRISQLITIGESYFFRDRSQFQMLRDYVIPDLLKKNQATRKIKVWSAACSSGEEAYSLAIMLSGVLPPNIAWEFSVIGTDINPDAIERAKRGRYSAWSFRMEQIGERQKYFNELGEQWEIKPEYKKRVNFLEGNLIQDTLPNYANELNELDLIVCRNVFIYFDKETVSAVVKKFYDCLSEGGYLLTGHGEVSRDEQRFSRCCYGDLVILKKEKMGSKIKSSDSSAWSSSRTLDRGISNYNSEMTASMTKEKTKTYIQTELTYASKKTKPNTADEINTFCEQAKKHANRGEYVEATSLCQQAININSQVALPHFLLAQIYELNNQASLAKQCLKKVIYLDHDYTPAYVQLANLYRFEGNTKSAKKMMQTALDILHGMPEHAVIPEYSESTVSEMRRYVEQWLSQEA